MPSAETMLDAYRDSARRAESQGKGRSDEAIRIGLAYLALFALTHADERKVRDGG